MENASGQEASEDKMHDREEFLYAVEMARALHDPATDWDAFRDTLWSFLIRVFGLEDGEGWPGDLPDPIGQVFGDAADVASCLDQCQRCAYDVDTTQIMVEVGLPTAGIVSDALLDDIEDHSTLARSAALLQRLLDDEEGE